METETQSKIEITGLRWATDRFATGEYRAYAWLAASAEQGQFAECTGVAGGTEADVLDGLRGAILRHFRKPTGLSVVNDLGWTLAAK